MISGLIGFVIAIAILVVVHEFGHYIVARLTGVSVLAFSIGFGKVLYRHIDKRGCEWRLSAIPLGGYIKMLSEEEREDLQEEYPNRTFDWEKAIEKAKAYKRLMIVLAGPAMNLIFAAFLYAALAINGGYEASPRVGTPLAGSQAESAHVQAGWTVTKIGKHEVATFSDVRARLNETPTGSTVSVYFRAESGEGTWIDFRQDKKGENTSFPFGITPYFTSVMVSSIEPNSPAETVGLKPGDTVLSANGTKITDVMTLVRLIRESAGKPIEFVLKSSLAEGTRTLYITPFLDGTKTGEKHYRIGATLFSVPDTVYVKHGPVEAVGIGFKQVSGFSMLTVRSLARMVTGEESSNSLVGPVTIGNMAGKSLTLGFKAFVNFLAIISIGLGIANLLPIPVLDGGHATLTLIEMVTGKRPSKQLLSILMRIGMGLLLCLMAFALFNDFALLFS